MIKVAIIGATGIAGQQAIVTLTNHPWFQITKLAASPVRRGRPMRRRSGKPTVLRVGGVRRSCRQRWGPVEDAADFDPTTVDLIFSTLDAGVAKELEPKWARTTPVVSTASAFRYEDDTPILDWWVNMDHAA